MSRRTLIALAIATLVTGTLSPAGAAPRQPQRAPVAASACKLPRSSFLDEGPSDFSINVRPIGVVKAVMLFVDFPDTPETGSTDPYFDQLSGGMAWYDEVSYGRVDLQITRVNQWVRMPQNSTAYPWPTALSFQNQRDYIVDAVAAADPVVDFSQFDIVYIVPTDEATALTFSPTFLANPGTGVIADGREIKTAVTYGQDMWFWGFKLLNHETGHIFSLPDLYAFSGDVHRFVGGWDLMGRADGPAPGYLAWHRWKLGWLDDDQIVCLTEAGASDHTLSPIESPGGPKAVVVRTGEKTAYVAEVRRSTGTDSAMCDDGLLVYEVDTSVATGQGPIHVQDAHPGSSTTFSCLEPDDGTFELGAGEDPTFQDAAAGVTIEVTGSTPTSMTLHVTRTTSFVSLQPDATIRLGSGVEKGQDVYNDSGAGQAITAKTSGSKTFTITVGNDGTVTDTFTLQGTKGANGFEIAYLEGSSGTTSITSEVVGGTYTIADLAPGDSVVIRVKITVTSKADPGRSRTAKITVASTGDPAAVDAIKAKVKAL